MSVDRAELEKFLKSRFMDASRDGTLHTWNWENEPLPAMANKTVVEPHLTKLDENKLESNILTSDQDLSLIHI